MFFATTSIQNLEVGQCYKEWDEFSGGKTGEYVPPTVLDADCAEPHAVEAFHIEDLPEARLASDEFDDADVERCIAPFESYVGVDYLDSELEIYAIFTSKGVGSRERQIACLVGHADATTLTTGSLKGTKR